MSVLKEYYEDIPVRALRPWLGIAVLMAILQSLPADVHEQLRFDRGALVAGEFMRLLTANFIHLGWNHLLLNMAGFLVVGWLFADEVPVAAWAFVLLVCCLASSLGLYWWTPDAFRVVGMSGALHGLFMFGATTWIVHGYRIGWVLLFGAAGKLLWEQTSGAIPFTEGIVGGPVETDAHLWGALGGLAAGFVLAVWHRFQPRL